MADRWAAWAGVTEAVTASAPGRVNLIGEHTDYNDGFVLPLVVPQRTTATVTPSGNGTVTATSDGESGAVSYLLGEEERSGGWGHYVAGITATLAAAGHRVGGFRLGISSQVPVGAGLGSSAALQVALLRALRQAFGLDLDDVALARLAHRAESEWLGVRVGIMDQLVASVAVGRDPMLIDCRSLELRRLRLPASVDLVLIDSGVRHRNAESGYKSRRSECERAAALLGVAALRDVEPADDRIARLPGPLPRRVAHVTQENERVLTAAAAIEAGDVEALGRLFDGSHASQRDLYEVSVPQVDRLVEILADDTEVLGARLTGGGFGGSVLALVPAGRARPVAERALRRYSEEQPTLSPRIVLPAPGDEIRGE